MASASLSLLGVAAASMAAGFGLSEASHVQWVVKPAPPVAAPAVRPAPAAPVVYFGDQHADVQRALMLRHSETESAPGF